MIIDMRCRLTTQEAAEYFRIQTQKTGVWDHVSALREGTEEAFFQEIGAAGVTTAVSVSGNNPGMKLGGYFKELPDRRTDNDYMADVQRRHWGRFIGVAGIDAGGVFHDPLQEIERCAALGLRAVFIEPGRSPGCYLDDPRLYPIYQKCVELDLALIPQTSGPLGGKLLDYADPVRIERVAREFPTLRIISGHAHYPYVREAIVVSTRCDNVWMSPDAYLFRLGTEDWLKAVNENHFGFTDKFIFGTAYPLLDIHQYVRRFFELPWRPEVLPRILYKNALAALKLEDDPTFRQMYRLDLPDAEVDPVPAHLKATQ